MKNNPNMCNDVAMKDKCKGECNEDCGKLYQFGTFVRLIIFKFEIPEIRYLSKSNNSVILWIRNWRKKTSFWDQCKIFLSWRYYNQACE